MKKPLLSRLKSLPNWKADSKLEQKIKRQFYNADN